MGRGKKKKKRVTKICESHAKVLTTNKCLTQCYWQEIPHDPPLWDTESEVQHHGAVSTQFSPAFFSSTMRPPPLKTSFQSSTGGCMLLATWRGTCFLKPILFHWRDAAGHALILHLVFLLTKPGALGDLSRSLFQGKTST